MTIQAGAILDVVAGVESGGTLKLAAGTASFELIVLSGGVVSGPGTVLGTNNDIAGSIVGVTLGEAANFGEMLIDSGGYASGINLADGEMEVANTAFAYGGQVSSNSVLVVDGGGFVSGVTVAGILVASGSVYNTVLSGGTIEVANGVQLSGVTGSGAIEFEGVISSVTLNSANILYGIGSGGAMHAGVVASGTTLLVEAGATASGVTVAGDMIVEGTASNTILNYGTIEETSGGQVIGVTGSGAVEFDDGYILSGATLNSASLVFEIGQGGAMDSGSVTSISTLVVESGGVASGVRSRAR